MSRYSGGKADKLQGRVAPGAARKKPTAPAYAPPASSATGKRQNQPAKETVIPTDKAEKTSVAGGPTNKVQYFDKQFQCLIFYMLFYRRQ